MTDPRTYAVWAGASLVAGAGVAGGLALTASSSSVTTLGLQSIGPGFSGLGNQALNQLISASQRALLRQFFKTGVLPEGLSARTLLIYAEIARRVVLAANDASGVQATRLTQIWGALQQLGK
jgi:hypothetical protein